MFVAEEARRRRQKEEEQAMARVDRLAVKLAEGFSGDCIFAGATITNVRRLRLLFFSQPQSQCLDRRGLELCNRQCGKNKES